MMSNTEESPILAPILGEHDHGAATFGGVSTAGDLELGGLVGSAGTLFGSVSVGAFAAARRASEMAATAAAATASAAAATATSVGANVGASLGVGAAAAVSASAAPYPAGPPVASPWSPAPSGGALDPFAVVNAQSLPPKSQTKAPRSLKDALESARDTPVKPLAGLWAAGSPTTSTSAPEGVGAARGKLKLGVRSYNSPSSLVTVGSSRSRSLEEALTPAQATLRCSVADLLDDDEHTNDGAARALLRDWCDAGCLRRYLAARPGKPEAAAAMLRATLVWRRSAGLDHARPRPCAKCLSDGPLSHNLRLVGFDESGRAVLYSCFAQVIRLYLPSTVLV